MIYLRSESGSWAAWNNGETETSPCCTTHTRKGMGRKEREKEQRGWKAKEITAENERVGEPSGK